MSDIRVIVHGALGKMGQTVLAAVARDGEAVPVAGVDAAATTDSLRLPDSGGTIPLSSTMEAIPASANPNVLVDFSIASATMPAVRWAAEHGVNFVVGTTGLTPENVREMEELAARHKVGAVVASNFALGAVVMMYLAQKAAPYFDYAEIIETHHETKIDAPSGTAMTTANMISEAAGKPLQRNVPDKETVAGTRAGEIGGVTIHSVRLPGAMAHQEVIFGAAGQTLHIKHDTINRDCYQPGIMTAVKHVVRNKGLVYGLDKLLGLGD